MAAIRDIAFALELIYPPGAAASIDAVEFHLITHSPEQIHLYATDTVYPRSLVHFYFVICSIKNGQDFLDKQYA